MTGMMNELVARLSPTPAPEPELAQAMKILVVVPSGFCFGLQYSELALFSRLRGRTHCHFLSTRWTDGEFNRRLDALGLAHSSTWLGMFSRRLDWKHMKMTAACLIRLPLAWRDFIRLYRSLRPDIVYLANHHEIILLLPLLVWIRRKVVCHMHDPPPAIGFQRFSVWLWRRGVGRFVFVSRSAQVRFAEIAPAGSGDSVIYNGIDIAPVVLPRARSDRFVRRFGWSDDAVVFGMCGQIGPHKGQEDFIEAAALALKQCPNARFVIGGRGEGDDLIRLQQIITAHALKCHIVFCGWLAEVAEFYDGIDVLVLASRHEEGFGLVLAEAGERGLPVIATRSGGAAEVVSDGETGLLVDKHAPHQLAAALQRLCGDADLRDRLGRRARDRVAARFDLAAQAGRMADFLAEVAASVRVR